jgi:hypothetical protein
LLALRFLQLCGHKLVLFEAEREETIGRSHVSISMFCVRAPLKGDDGLVECVLLIINFIDARGCDQKSI